jgi:hypothetical protein
MKQIRFVFKGLGALKRESRFDDRLQKIYPDAKTDVNVFDNQSEGRTL